MRNPLLLAFFTALFLCGAAIVSAQTSLEFKTVHTVGPVPSITQNFVSRETTILGFSMDPIGQRLHWVLNNDWYRLHLPTRTWTRHSIQNGFDLQHPRWSVVPGSLELRAWDEGLGRVIRIDSNGVPIRIDQSFNQKTQYTHLHHVEEDGTIHAIGGNGLYHPKNYGVSFSETSRGWHRTAGKDLVTTDPFLSGGSTLRDPLTKKMVLFGKHGEARIPDTYGILNMDMVDGSIGILHRETPVVLNKEIRGYSTWPSVSVVNGTHRIAFFHTTSTSQNRMITNLSALDLDTYRISELSATNGSDLDTGSLHWVLHYNEEDSSLYSVQWSHITVDFVNFMTVTKAKVDVDAVKAALRNGTPPEEASIQTPDWATRLAIGSVLLLIITASFCFLKKRKTNPTLPSMAPVKPERVRVSLTLSPLRLNERSWNDHLGTDFTLEARLLELLAEAMASGQPVVSSDTIDRMLIPNHPSPDYIRKTRNHTRKRLEEILQDVFPASEPYILADRDVIDKRKTKLQLNPELVMVSRPE